MKEFSYEDYKKTIKDIKSDWFEMSEKQYSEMIENARKYENYENKIDKLASDFIYYMFDKDIDVPNKEIYGYYTILEHCIKKIKEKDKNLLTGYVADTNLENKE